MKKENNTPEWGKVGRKCFQWWQLGFALEARMQKLVTSLGQPFFSLHFLQIVTPLVQIPCQLVQSFLRCCLTQGIIHVPLCLPHSSCELACGFMQRPACELGLQGAPHLRNHRLMYIPIAQRWCQPLTITTMAFHPTCEGACVQTCGESLFQKPGPSLDQHNKFQSSPGEDRRPMHYGHNIFLYLGCHWCPEV